MQLKYFLPLSLFFLQHFNNCIAQAYCDSSVTGSAFPICINDSIINEAKKYLGIKYKFGGVSDKGFDCSGFTAEVFSSVSIKLPHSAKEQSDLGIPIDVRQCQKGDLIFFKGRGLKSNRVDHVGIIVDNNDSLTTFIHASVHSGITISKLDEPYYKKRYICVRHILNDTLTYTTKINTEIDTTKTTKPIESNAKVKTDTISATIHTVKRGETLYHIAQKYGVSINDLKKWNHLNSNLIKPGETLKISR